MLTSAGEGEKFRVKLFGIVQEKLFLSGKPVTMEVEKFDYDKITSKFSGVLEI